jgi:RNA polymerase sigma-70 factor (ECF subfamily)
MDGKERQQKQRFSEVYAAFYGHVFAYAARRVGEEAADDITAETFMVAWRRFDVMPSDSLPWLYGVARNMLLRARANHARQEATKKAMTEEGVVAESAESSNARLWEAWASLSETDREVLALVAWEELRVTDAARVIGCSASVFSVRLYRARKRFERLLEPSRGTSTRLSNLSEAS